MPEALWISFKPVADGAVEGRWKLRYHGGATDIDPFDIVEHGAVHLHALGADGSVVLTKAFLQRPPIHPQDTPNIAFPTPVAPEIEIKSLDVPVVSAGLLSPFPTALNNVTADNTPELIDSWLSADGWHYNVQNQIWCEKVS